MNDIERLNNSLNDILEKIKFASFVIIKKNNLIIGDFILVEIPFSFIRYQFINFLIDNIKLYFGEKHELLLTESLISSEEHFYDHPFIKIITTSGDICEFSFKIPIELLDFKQIDLVRDRRMIKKNAKEESIE